MAGMSCDSRFYTKSCVRDGEQQPAKLMQRLQLLIILLISLTTHAAGQRSHKDARNKFHDVLFVVKYNFNASIDKVLLHHSLWRRAFKNQLIVVQWTQAQINKYRLIYGLSDSDYRIATIQEKPNECGFLAYEAWTTAMISYPHFSGYLYVHDDMAMNVSKLMELDMDSLWVTADSQCLNDIDWVNKKNDWMWWNTEWGTKNIQKFLDSRTDFAMELQECFGSEKIWCFGQSDFFYVPRSLKDSTIRVLTAYRAYDIFLEIAMPTFHHCYVPKNRTVELPICTTWDKERNNFPMMHELCKKKDYSLFHPIKLTSDVNIAGMVETMSLVDKGHLSSHNHHLPQTE